MFIMEYKINGVEGESFLKYIFEDPTDVSDVKTRADQSRVWM